MRGKEESNNFEERGRGGSRYFRLRVHFVAPSGEKLGGTTFANIQQKLCPKVLSLETAIFLLALL